LEAQISCAEDDASKLRRTVGEGRTRKKKNSVKVVGLTLLFETGQSRGTEGRVGARAQEDVKGETGPKNTGEEQERGKKAAG